MPTIDPALIPTISAGNLFDRLTTDTSLNIRWLLAMDPVYFEAINRPIADIAVRQLILAKALDAINLRLSHQSNFPFLIPARVLAGTTEYYLPASWIWDLHASLPKKWENLRLAKIKRIDGTNSGSSSGLPTGTLRLIFTANETGSTTEIAVFQQDYDIDSVLSFQRLAVLPVSTSEEPTAIDPGEDETVGGFIVFRTLDLTDPAELAFIEALAPSTGTGPAVYEIVDTPVGGASVDDDFSLTAVSHGTGICVPSSWNAIPSLDSDINTWLGAFNYPFRANATRTSTSPIIVTIPSPMFKEFDITAPGGDEPTGDVSGEFSPVWISRIERLDDTANTLKFFFATYNIMPGAASVVPIEFATLTLQRDWAPDRIVDIEIIDDIYGVSDSDQALWRNFGRGHVVLSSLWDGNVEIDDFFDAFQSVLDSPPDVVFDKSTTILGAPGAVSRAPKTTPTDGQWRALFGSTARRDNPIDPSDENRYITEQDQGLGDEVNFNTLTGFTPNADIEAVANTGALAHRVVKLVVNGSGTSHTYDEDILPRLRALLGRDPEFGDEWYDGTRKKFFNGDTWQG